MPFPETDWIFFDCFNTLLDEFDEAGEEGGLYELPALAAGHGFFATAEAFRGAYTEVRAATVRLGQEMPLGDRLRQTLEMAPVRRTPDEIAAEVARLVAAWEPEFARRLRLTPGVQDMLEYWVARRKLAVVANSFLPGLPERYLQRFGLARFFRFFLDSASFGFKKPNPLIGMEALSQAGLGPCDGAQVLAVGDRHDLDVAAALDLGMHVVHFNRQRLRPGAAPTPAGIPVIYDWSEFR
jgi:putative hydrolase of the HAD superfamily